jgi:hypothetical protein
MVGVNADDRDELSSDGGDKVGREVDRGIGKDGKPITGGTTEGGTVDGERIEAEGTAVEGETGMDS